MSDFQGFYWKGNIDDYFLGHQFAEIFKDRIYDPYFLGKKDLVVFDIGANLGVFSLYATKFAKVIHAFEPATEAYSCLTHMVTENAFTNVIPHNMAIANTDGKQTFFHRGVNKTMNSLKPDMPTTDTEEVTTIRLDTFFTNEKIEHVDFMKLDVEGSEFDIVCGDGFQNVAQKIDEMVIEVHTWANRNLNQLREALQIAGFTKIEQIPNEAILIHAKK